MVHILQKRKIHAIFYVCMTNKTAQFIKHWPTNSKGEGLLSQLCSKTYSLFLFHIGKWLVACKKQVSTGYDTQEVGQDNYYITFA